MRVSDPSVLDAIRQAGLDPEVVADVVARTLDEDLGDGPDVTASATIPTATLGRADVVSGQDGVVAGLAVAACAFDTVGEGRLRIEPGTVDAAPISVSEVLLTVRGPVRDIVTAERGARNLLAHLSGVATLTAAWVRAVAATRTTIRDTRETTPGLRVLEKYAVRCGGGLNHRLSLSDAAHVGPAHVAAAGDSATAFELVRDGRPGLAIEVEVDSVDASRAAVDAGAELVQLRDFSDPQLIEATQYAHDRGVRTEAYGRITLDRAAAVAATGVDYLAVGALTSSAPALAVGLELFSGTFAHGGER